MLPVMGVVATLLPPVLLQRLRLATRERHEVVACDEWPQLMRACEQSPVRVAVIDLFGQEGGKPVVDRLRQLKQRLPRLTIIGYVVMSLDHVRDLFDAGRQGIDGLVIADQDDSPIELARAIAIAESRSLADVVRRMLRGVDHVVYDAVMIAITRAHERLSPLGLARQLGIPRRTVAHRLAQAGYPPPLRLLTWGRLIVAAHMMEEPHRSADRVAASLSFPSGSAFRNTCHRYLHATPTQIRSRGGAAYVIRTFFRQVTAAPRADGVGSSRRRHRLALAV
jgi:AraC-like DNA-binding protein